MSQFARCKAATSSSQPKMTLYFVVYVTLLSYVSASASVGVNRSVNTYQSVQACLTSRGVPTSFKSSSDWTALTTPFNLRLEYSPAAVTLPNTPQQVSDSVLCAEAAGVKVQARSGGHSYGSFSLGGKNGSLVVDLQNFNAISLDNGKSCRNTLRT